jgi:hypothetical protein
MSAPEDLWNSAVSSDRLFEPGLLATIPEGGRRYLEHAIAAGTPLAAAVRLHMHGEIRLKGWHPFSAEEVIVWTRGMIWRAAVRMHGISIRGGDSFVDGYGAMRWKMFGVIPLVNASGPDITRSAAGRVNVESIWLPSVLCGREVAWMESDPCQPQATFTAHGERSQIDYVIDERGGLRSVNTKRWGNPENAAFHYADCGGFVDEEGTFGGYTVPTRMRVGWHFGSPAFEAGGEFFRVIIDSAVYK